MHRNLILGSTAVVAACLAATPEAAAADPITLRLGGYMMSYITLGKIDRDVVGGTNGTSYEPETFRYEGEIWFMGETKLDNGTTIGVRVELEAWSQGGSAADQMDEEYVYAFGNWGRIEFGGTNAASYKTVVSSLSAIPGWGFQDPTFSNKGSGFSSANNGGRDRGTNSGMGASNSSNAGDATVLSYFTPRFGGFQFAFSYVPSFAVGGNTTATCSFRGGGGNFNNCPRDANTWNNGIDVSANYAGQLGDVAVKLTGGYMTASFDRGTANSVAADSASGRWKSWAAGAQLGYAGFALGGGLGRDNNGLFGSNTTRWYTAALLYETGPWRMSVGWWGGRNNDGNAVPGTQNAPGKDRMDIFEAGASYQLSRGIKLVGGINYVMGAGQSKSEKADAWAFMFGTDLRF